MKLIPLNSIQANVFYALWMLLPDFLNPGCQILFGGLFKRRFIILTNRIKIYSDLKTDRTWIFFSRRLVPELKSSGCVRLGDEAAETEAADNNISSKKVFCLDPNCSFTLCPELIITSNSRMLNAGPTRSLLHMFEATNAELTVWFSEQENVWIMYLMRRNTNTFTSDLWRSNTQQITTKKPENKQKIQHFSSRFQSDEIRRMIFEF